eukprot:s985_g1.t1
MTGFIEIPVQAMVRYLQQRRFFQMRPVALKQVMNHWQSQTALEQVRRQPTRKSTRNMSSLEVKTMGRGRGHIGVAASLRCRLRQAVEPAPAVTVRLRPPYATEVAVLLVLFAWLALGVRPFFWMMICCHLCSRWFPFPLVAAAAVFANFLRYQVKRRLARLQMMRTRSQLEADGLLLLLLLLGAACAGTGQGGLSLFELRPGGLRNLPPPPQELDASPPLGFIFWFMLVVVSLVAMGTVAKCPEDLEGADYWAPLRHGCAWAVTGSANGQVAVHCTAVDWNLLAKAFGLEHSRPLLTFWHSRVPWHSLRGIRREFSKLVARGRHLKKLTRPSVSAWKKPASRPAGRRSRFK